MSLKDHLRQQLVGTRAFSEKLLAVFEKPEDWTYQVHPRCNHALWFAGHIANTDNFLIKIVAPERAGPKASFQERFGMGSQPTSLPTDYPPPAEVLDYMRERRRTLLEILDSMDEAALETKTPSGSPEFLPDFASIFRTAGWHEGVHAGQLTVVRRALGYPPLSDQPAGMTG